MVLARHNAAVIFGMFTRRSITNHVDRTVNVSTSGKSVYQFISHATLSSGGENPPNVCLWYPCSLSKQSFFTLTGILLLGTLGENCSMDARLAINQRISLVILALLRCFSSRRHVLHALEYCHAETYADLDNVCKVTQCGVCSTRQPFCLHTHAATSSDSIYKLLYRSTRWCHTRTLPSAFFR